MQINENCRNNGTTIDEAMEDMIVLETSENPYYMGVDASTLEASVSSHWKLLADKKDSLDYCQFESLKIHWILLYLI